MCVYVVRVCVCVYVCACLSLAGKRMIRMRDNYMIIMTVHTPHGSMHILYICQCITPGLCKGFPVFTAVYHRYYTSRNEGFCEI